MNYNNNDNNDDDDNNDDNDEDVDDDDGDDDDLCHDDNEIGNDNVISLWIFSIVAKFLFFDVVFMINIFLLYMVAPWHHHHLSSTRSQSHKIVTR